MVTEKLTDANYIRNAAELADGWSIDNFWLYSPDDEYRHNVDFPISLIFLDALAAQLRRQCRDIDVWRDVLCEMLGDVMPENYDEAMHHIKKVVDLGVLERKI